MQQPIPIQDYKLKIIKIIDETLDTKTFRLENNGISFYPGQFFMVRFEDSETFKRAYSIASSPTQKKYIDITMNLVGKFTKKLWQTRVGSYLLFKGPYGKFYFNEEIKIRYFYKYDENNILINEIMDNGSAIQIDNLENATRRSIKKITPRNIFPYG